MDMQKISQNLARAVLTGPQLQTTQWWRHFNDLCERASGRLNSYDLMCVALVMSATCSEGCEHEYLARAVGWASR